MVINGRPDLACKTLTKELPDEITLMPLPVFKLIGDLSVDTGTWFRATNEKIGSWIHTNAEFDPHVRCSLGLLDIADLTEYLPCAQNRDTLGRGLASPYDIDLSGQDKVHAPADGALLHQELSRFEFAWL